MIICRLICAYRIAYDVGKNIWCLGEQGKTTTTIIRPEDTFETNKYWRYRKWLISGVTLAQRGVLLFLRYLVTAIEILVAPLRLAMGISPKLLPRLPDLRNLSAEQA
ncbi:MAG: hypothetical protein IPO92_15210 [Saprospiraceae bacterium]|nr:hypothetical protein [Saprospiraceae bacterium]